MSKLYELAEKVGVLTSFRDAGLAAKDYSVNEDTIKFLLSKLGYDAGNESKIKKSIEKFDNKRWEEPLEKIYVVNHKNICFDLVLSDVDFSDDIEISFGKKNSSKFTKVKFDIVGKEEKKIGKESYVKTKFKLDDTLDIGYYDLEIRVKNNIYISTIAAAPDKCYETRELENKKMWGFALQLYSLKSKRNWGVGDFTDLNNFVDICSRAGASVIGLNPLNVLQHDFPENASPYSSINRLFLNPIYIDVENVPEFNKDDIKPFNKDLEKLRNEELIQYTEIYPLKIKILEVLHKRFMETKDEKRKKKYLKFVSDNEAELEKLVLFQAIYEDKSKVVWGGWRAWESEYRNISSKEIATYKDNNYERIEFFKFLQFEANRQLSLVYENIKDKKLSVGLYRDLAVGVGGDSAELWSNSELFIENAGAGAPPDAFFSTGQKWGLGAFNPFKLKEVEYEPFIKILRANMEMAGALRVDHVMSLMRLYIIPDHMDIGTYVMYNFDDMMNIVKIESYLNKCIVVGESIGNVPDGFLGALSDANIKSLSVLWAERYGAGWGDFVSPRQYPVDAFVSIGTHDMAPLRMWWFGYDIELSFSLGLIKTEEEKISNYKKRENDRWKLLCALDNEGVWPIDNLRSGDYVYGEKYPEGIEEAVHRFMSRTNSKVFLAQLEDILHVEKMQNLPGTDRDKHPNWRRKVPVNLEDLEKDIAYIRNIKAIKMER